MAAKNDLGWYGKLPTAGDFLQRRLSATLVDNWSNWFRPGVAHWQHQYGGDSTQFGLAPIWNFALPATLGVQRVQIGCMMPSRDRVGRCWPLLAVKTVPTKHWHPAQLAVSGEWFQELGATLYQAVHQLHSVDWLEQALNGMPPLSQPATGRSDIMDILGYQDLPCTLAWREVAIRFDPLQYTSYWWTNQGDGYPLTSHKHSGNLTAQLFSQLFHPAAGSGPGRHGLYPPMFE